jgi:hypothetical protein
LQHRFPQEFHEAGRRSDFDVVMVERAVDMATTPTRERTKLAVVEVVHTIIYVMGNATLYRFYCPLTPRGETVYSR